MEWPEADFSIVECGGKYHVNAMWPHGLVNIVAVFEVESLAQEYVEWKRYHHKRLQHMLAHQKREDDAN